MKVKVDTYYLVTKDSKVYHIGYWTGINQWHKTVCGLEIHPGVFSGDRVLDSRPKGFRMCRKCKQFRKERLRCVRHERRGMSY